MLTMPGGGDDTVADNLAGGMEDSQAAGDLLGSQEQVDHSAGDNLVAAPKAVYKATLQIG